MNLREKAEENVKKRREELLQNEIEEEYKRLKYESEFVAAGDEALEKIKDLHEKFKNMKIHGFAHAYVVHGIRNTLDKWVRDGKYHPRQLKEFENETLKNDRGRENVRAVRE